MANAGTYLKVILLVLLAGQIATTVAAERGKLIGGIPHQAPSWFKNGFLEIADDVDEASEQGKHVPLFFQLNNCPYCHRMLEDAFETEPLTSFIQQHFDAIAIKAGMRHVAGGSYKQVDFWTYLERRTEGLLAAGVVIDIGRPKP